MADEVVLGLIGCGGNMGGHVNRGYKTLWEAGLRDFRIAATCDIDKSKAEKLAADAETFQGTRPAVYTSHEEMLEKEADITACDISIVHSEHHKVAIPCFEAGKHVTIEKPLGITCRAAQAIIDAANKAGKLLQTAENYRRKPGDRAIQWAVQSGRIGEPRMIFWLQIRERMWYWGWREEKELAGGGWTMDGGVHYADLFRYVLGPVRTMYALSKQHCPTRYKNREEMTDPIEVSVEDTTVAVFEFESGVTGQWTSTNVAPGDTTNKSIVYGSEGSVAWGGGLKTKTQELSSEELTDEYMKSLSDEERAKWFPSGVTESLSTELWEFMQAIRGKAELETDGVEGLKALAICMAIYESAVLGQPVEIAKVENCEIETYQQELNEAGGLV